MRLHSEIFAHGYLKMCEWCHGVDRCQGGVLCKMAAGYAQCQVNNRLKMCCTGLVYGTLQDRIVALALVRTPGILHDTQDKELRALAALSTFRPFNC